MRNNYKYILLFLLSLAQQIKAQITPENTNTNNIVFSEYVNTTANAPRIFNNYNASGTTNYDIAIRKAITFNQNYDNGNFSTFVFHGRYYVNVENVQIVQKGWTSSQTDDTVTNGRLQAIKAKYKKKSGAYSREMKEFFIKDLSDRLKATLKTKVGANHRFIVIGAVEVYFLSFENYQKSQEVPNSTTISAIDTYNQLFWETEALNTQETAIINEIKSLRTQSYSAIDAATGQTYNYQGVNNRAGTLEQSVRNASEVITSALMFQKNRSQIISTPTASGLTILLNGFPDIAFSLLTVDERYHILKKFSVSPMTDSFLWGTVGNNRENIAIKVLENTPKNQHDGMLVKFKALDADFLQNLLFRIDGDNFSALIKHLSNFVYSTTPLPSNNEATVRQYIQNKRFISFQHGKGMPFGAGKYCNMDFASRPNVPFTTTYDQEIKDALAFEYILVRFDDAYSVGNQYYPAGYTDFIPVITLYGLYNDSANRKVRLMVDGLFLATGVGGMVRQSGKMLTVAILDAAIASTDIILGNLLVDRLNANAEGQEVLKYWNRFALCYGVGRLGGLALQSGQYFYKSGRNYLTKNTDTELKKILDDLEAKEPKIKDVPLLPNRSVLVSETKDNAKKYFIDGLEVATSKISGNGYLSFDIRIPKELQRQGYASEIFEDTIDFYTKLNKPINGIQGRWLSMNTYENGMSTNLKSFIDDYIHNNKSFSDAALNTPTGKIASNYDFTKVIKGDWDILDLGGTKPTQIYWMELKFIKP